MGILTQTKVRQQHQQVQLRRVGLGLKAKQSIPPWDNNEENNVSLSESLAAELDQLVIT